MKNEIMLANGMAVPPLGFGTWKLNSGAECTETVTRALDVGYRYFDCAYSYGNDFFVGKAIKNSEVRRSDIFVTNKLWRNIYDKESVASACKKSLKLMKLDYFDLYLIHWPVPITEEKWEEKNAEIWSAMVSLYKEGAVRAIGVSNYLPHHIEATKLSGESIAPMVNQIERHPGYAQNSLVQYCKENGICLQAWSPLGSGNISLNSGIEKLADKYNCTASQLALIWNVQSGIIPICRSKSIEHMKENLFLPDIILSDEDMKLLDRMEGINSSGFHPDINPAK